MENTINKRKNWFTIQKKFWMISIGFWSFIRIALPILTGIGYLPDWIVYIFYFYVEGMEAYTSYAFATFIGDAFVVLLLAKLSQWFLTKLFDVSVNTPDD